MVQIIALVAHAVRRRETAATRSEEGVLSGFGTADGEEVRNEQLLIAKYKRRTLRDEFDYDHPEQCIKLDDREEITRLKALLNREFPETGRYSLAQADAHSAINQAVSALSADGKADANAIHQLVQALADIAGAETSSVLVITT